MTAPNQKLLARTKRIILVDDHPVMRQGFARIIEDQPDLEVCAQFDSAAGVLEAAQKQTPDLIVVDICLDDAHGLELIKDLRAQHERLPILALSMYDELLYAERAVRAGANGYVMKRSDTSSVIEAIRTVLDGGLWLGEGIRERMLDKFLGRKAANASSLEGLSDREFEVFQLIGQGLKTRQIAGKLSISPKTVDTYRAHLKEKLNLENGTELVRHALHWVERQGDLRRTS
jgi:DNA-binding NarL/FixJ family response regulator